jgi:DNA polymerase-3 subunit alpha
MIIKELSGINYELLTMVEECIETEDVFDIEVENTHNFFANGICVHNCIGGRLAKTVFDNYEMGVNPKELVVDNRNFEKIQEELKKVSEQFIEVFGKENFYPEIQFNALPAQHLVNMHLLELSRRSGLKLVATCDSHYSDPTHWREREIYKAMAWASKTHGTVEMDSLPKTVDELKCELFPKNAEQLWESYKRYSKNYEFYAANDVDKLVCDAIEITHDIAHQQIGKIEFDTSVKLPKLNKIVERETVQKYEKETEDDIAFKELVRVSIEGLKKRKKINDPRYIERLQKELEDIKFLQDNYGQYKIAKYFLTEKKIIDITSEELFTGNGRGSVSGSLLAYALGITHVDSIRFGTIWERFLSRKKLGMPDIDQDWSDRDQAYKMVAEYFGAENVIPVSNFSQLQLRSLIKDIARLNNIPFDEINAATSKIELEVLNEKKKEDGFDRQVWVLTYEEAEKHSPTFVELMQKYPQFESTVRVLFKQFRNISRHAGGVVVTSDSRTGMPMIKTGGELQTPWPEGVNFRHLEQFGLLKFDILGLGTLRIFENCIRKILKKYHNIPNPTFKQVREWFEKNLHPDNSSLDDIKVFKNVFWDGNYTNIFQFTSQQTQDFMRQMKPTTIMDIAITTSIFRPGPLGIQVDKKYLNNRSNPESIKYAHPVLKEVFGETSGLLIFQEQLQMIYHKLAGVPLAETDSVRKAFTKKEINNKEKAAKDREVLRSDFIEKCEKVSGLEREVSAKLFDEMESLVSYSFNKSHAIAYAITSYQCAWLQTYYPDEWIAAGIDYCSTEKGRAVGKEDPKAKAIQEAKALGYRFAKPDINISEYETMSHPTEPKTLVPSFSSLKYVGKTVVDEIKRIRPYKNIMDLLLDGRGSWRHSKFNKRALATLIRLEALDSMELPTKNYKQLYWVLIENFDLLKKTNARKKNNDIKPIINDLIVKAQELYPEDWTKDEKISSQIELSGSFDLDLIVSDKMLKHFSKKNIPSIDEISSMITDEENVFWGIVKKVEIATTKTGKKYLKIFLFGPSYKENKVFVWSFKDGSEVPFNQNDIIVGIFKKTDFGISTFMSKIYKLQR